MAANAITMSTIIGALLELEDDSSAVASADFVSDATTESTGATVSSLEATVVSVLSCATASLGADVVVVAAALGANVVVALMALAEAIWSTTVVVVAFTVVVTICFVATASALTTVSTVEEEVVEEPRTAFLVRTPVEAEEESDPPHADNASTPTHERVRADFREERMEDLLLTQSTKPRTSTLTTDSVLVNRRDPTSS